MRYSFLIIAAACSTAHASDKDAFTLLSPTPRELMRAVDTDRPDTTESPHTVDAGHFQFEWSFADFSYDRRNDAGETARVWEVAPVNIKIGLLNNTDIQFLLTPYIRERTTDRATDSTTTIDGFGDATIRLKQNIVGNDEGDFALAIMPFITLPPAKRSLGVGDVECGIIVPMGFDLPNEFSLGLMGEIDIVRSADRSRYVVDFVHTATINRRIAGDLSGFIEYAGFHNFNNDEDYRASFNCGLVYEFTPDFRLDAGIRVGLTEAAEDLGVFVGGTYRD
ncbi:MAG TPA: transporter [Phycisphaerales bacterium]